MSVCTFWNEPLPHQNKSLTVWLPACVRWNHIAFCCVFQAKSCFHSSSLVELSCSSQPWQCCHSTGVTNSFSYDLRVFTETAIVLAMRTNSSLIYSILPSFGVKVLFSGCGVGGLEMTTFFTMLCELEQKTKRTNLFSSCNKYSLKYKRTAYSTTA